MYCTVHELLAISFIPAIRESTFLDDVKYWQKLIYFVAIFESTQPILNVAIMASLCIAWYNDVSA